MSLKLNISDVKQIYGLLKQKAFDEYNHQRYNAAWHMMHEAEALIQEFNWEYADEELEQMMQQLAEQWIPSQTTNYKPQTTNDNRVVVMDDWCVSYILVLQYIDALVEAGREILYITSRDTKSGQFPDIIARLSGYPNLSYEIIPAKSKPVDQWCAEVYRKIVDFEPSKIIAHIGPCSQFLPVIARLPKEITTYRSNLDDQCFWIGRSVIDYSLEFRPFGVAVSRERRGINPEQQLYVPFYPIQDGNPFGGFPDLPQDSVILFSGGDFYKTLDPNYTFWNLVRRMLQENPKAVLLYATKHGLRPQQEFLERFVKDNHLEKQFYNIGFRSDINEVFAHADIFLGTCPVCGSLTSQLAAMNHTAILQYYLPNTYDDETEQALNFNNPNLQLSFDDEEAFLAEAKRLINDADYRKKKTDLAYQSTIKPEQFKRVFMAAITTNVAPCPTKKVDYAEVARRWFWPDQMGFDDHLSYLVPKMKGLGLLHKMPMLWVKYNYQRFFAQKLFSPKWYVWKLKQLCMFVGYFKCKAWIKKQLFYHQLRKEDTALKRQYAKEIEALPMNLLQRNNDASDIVVSLTSFGHRVASTVPYTLLTLFKQTRMPNRIVLWLDNEHWNDANLPPILKRLKECGLEIYYCDDIRSFKKLIPSLKMFPNNPIIVVDDDSYYDKDLVKWLMDAYEQSDKRTIFATCGNVPVKKDGRYVPYTEWRGEQYADENTDIALIGCGGAIYPPHIFDEEIMNSDVFMSKCPTADDLWFWVQSQRMGVPMRLTPRHGYHLLRPVDKIEDFDVRNANNLTRINVIGGKNNQQLETLLQYYHIE